MEKDIIKIKKILDSLELKRDKIGYYYWIDAYIFSKPTWEKMKKVKIGDIYDKIAKKYNTTSSAVIAALRSVIYHKKNNIKDFFKVNININCKTLLILLLDYEVKNV